MSGFNHYLGLDEDYDEVNCTMYTNRCVEFKNLCKERVCYYSKNDPFVRFDKLDEFANLIDAKKIVSDTAGHFNKSAGYSEFNELLSYIK